jgi:hypothetical protein
MKIQRGRIAPENIYRGLFTHQAKKNNGELPQYYVTDATPLIDSVSFSVCRRKSLGAASLKISVLKRQN